MDRVEFYAFDSSAIGNENRCKITRNRRQSNSRHGKRLLFDRKEGPEKGSHAPIIDSSRKEDYDTIGGFVFSEFGRVHAVGESMTWNDTIRVTVLDASRRRVNRVRLERVRKESLEAV